MKTSYVKKAEKRREFITKIITFLLLKHSEMTKKQQRKVRRERERYSFRAIDLRQMALEAEKNAIRYENIAIELEELS